MIMSMIIMAVVCGGLTGSGIADLFNTNHAKEVETYDNF